MGMDEIVNISNYENMFCACVWPRALPSRNLKYIIDKISCIGEIIDDTSVVIPKDKMKYLICQVYADDDWIGSAKSKYCGAKRKGNNCYIENESVHFLFFRSSVNTITRVALKEEIRAHLGVGKHSVHITDTVSEVYRIAQVALNPNSLDFIINGKPDRYPKIERMVNKFDKVTSQMGIENKEFVFDSSTILGLYGIRKPRDVDYLSLNYQCMRIEKFGIDCHNNSAEYSQTIQELVFNPHNYFVWKENKYILLSYVLESKKQRGNRYDIWDLKLTDRFINSPKSVITRAMRLVYDIDTNLRYCKNALAYSIRRVIKHYGKMR